MTCSDRIGATVEARLASRVDRSPSLCRRSALSGFVRYGRPSICRTGVFDAWRIYPARPTPAIGLRSYILARRAIIGKQWFEHATTSISNNVEQVAVKSK
ncbi:hypothetical protein EUU23_10675 [Sphingorhabdus sp. IMCC26285]|uniref:Uncharacterized protein n=1 Tax=Sphingorhabdus profundilacus TaxID=2509718 RepID=A0A6I4LX71_9SPHN|nr:hypothetical protein [Sphingorhabdus profundilacus]MVZ98157.1 hypothetical protein [Sphingorhabdus profundilacus]